MSNRRDYDPASAPPDGRRAAHRKLFDASSSEPRRGSIRGADLGSGVTVLAYGTAEVGVGPRLHVHPSDETFIVIEGTARFIVGEEELVLTAGNVVLGPAGVPHKFVNVGPGRLQTIDIHHSPFWIQTDLE